MTPKRQLPINLESVLDLSVKLNDATDESFILNTAILSMMGKLTILRACALIPNREQTMFSVTLTKGKHNLKQVPFFLAFKPRELSAQIPIEKTLYDQGFRYVVPMIYNGELLALIVLGKPLEFTELSAEALSYLQIVSTFSANALQNVRNQQSLITAKLGVETRNQLLSSMFEMSSDFSSLLSRNQILRTLSYRLMGQLMVSRFAVFLLSGDGGFLPIMNRFNDVPGERIMKELWAAKKVSFVENCELHPNSAQSLESIGVRVVSPMIVQGTAKGLLLVGRKMGSDDFTDENLLFIDALSSTAISALENERLFQEELEKKRLERELELALEIQKNLLPKSTPKVDGYDISGISIPSLLVGGDYFDFVPLPGNRLLIAIADVSGKGMPAALLMANVQAALRVLAPLDLPLTEFVEKINSIVYQNTSADKFVTFFCGVLDAESGEYCYVNAGHNPPLHVSATMEVNQLTEGGIILGIADAKFPYSSGKTTISHGDTIVFYTDGITESINVQNKEFGEERLKFEILNNLDLSAIDLKTHILDAVEKHSEEMNQFDDLTLIVLKRN